MVAASLQITAKGQPVIYYGEELGYMAITIIHIMIIDTIWIGIRLVAILFMNTIGKY